MDYLPILKQNDPEIYKAVTMEAYRQHSKLELIASENFVSYAVLGAIGTPLQNKYAEGYPGKRYYGGCEYVDICEELAIERAKKLFGAAHVNVQPHSGAQANSAAIMAAANPGDTLMGLELSHGGHLTHGHPLNMSGRWFKVVSYGVEPGTEILDYDHVEKIALESKPKVLICGASAYSRKWDFKRLREIADKVGAVLFADVAHYAGLIAAGLYPSPIGHAQIVTTTVHKTLRGPRSGMVMCDEDWAAEIDKAVFPGIQGGPLMHMIAAKAVCFGEALKPEFKVYQQQVLNNATALSKRLMENGIRVISGGTDSHIVLAEVKTHGVTGRKIELRCDKLNITINKNTIPFDTEKPLLASGIRLGTPACTTRGFKEAEFITVADIVADSIKVTDTKEWPSIRARVKELSDKFPLYPELWKGEPEICHEVDNPPKKEES